MPLGFRRFCLGVLVLAVAWIPVAAAAPVRTDTVARFYTRVHKRDTPYEQALENAADFDLFFGIEPGQAGAFRARKPGLTLLFYELPGGRFRGEGDFDAVNAHEDWFVHDPSGRRITQGSNLALLDMGSPQYRAYEIDFIVKNVAAGPLDGVLLDVVHPAWVQGSRDWSPPVPAAVQQAWAGNMMLFLEGLRAKLPAGKKLIWNGVSTREDRATAWAGWEQKTTALADGGQMDGFCYNRRNPYGEGEFAYQLRRLRDMAGAGKMTLVKAAVKEGGGGRGADRLEAFCFAAYLLVADGRNVFYYPAHDLNRGRIQGVPVYSAGLGAPVGEFTRAGPLFRRDFARGMVLVNPTGAPASLPLEAPLLSVVEGKQVTTAALEPYGGAILVKP